jgi:hypothetical protein
MIIGSSSTHIAVLGDPMPINAARVLLGGTAAAAIRVVGQRVLDAVLFTDAVASGSTTVVLFALQLLIGFATVWIYAVMRPRFGATARTGIAAGVVTWAIAALAWSLTVVMGSVPLTMYLTRVVAALPIALMAALVGARLYRETDAVRARAAVVSPSTASDYR